MVLPMVCAAAMKASPKSPWRSAGRICAENAAVHAIGQDGFQAVAHFQAAATVADSQQQQDAFVLAFLAHAPGAKDGVGDILDGLAFQGGDGDQGHLGAGGLLHGGAVGFQLAFSFGVDDAGEIADVALRVAGPSSPPPSRRSCTMPARTPSRNHLVMLKFQCTTQSPVDSPAVRLVEWIFTGTSSNGKTADSGSAYRGSNPCVPANPPYAFEPQLRYDGRVDELRRITVNPSVMGGKPCIRGMRVTVGMIVEAMAGGRSVPDLLADFPYLEEEDIREALSYAARLAQGREIRLAS